MYLLYKLFSYLVFSRPVAKIILNRRFERGKESKRSIQEKLCDHSIKRPSGKVVWIHAASVGEMKSVIPLIKHIQKNANIHFLISTCTLTSAKLFETMNLKGCTHVFAPLDNPNFVKIFLKTWQPNLGVFIDSELWPNLLIQASHKMPLLSLNTRLSDKSYKQWKRLCGFATKMFNAFNMIFPASKEDCDKLSYFVSPDKLTFLGNLKSTTTPVFSKKEQTSLKKSIGNKRIFLAASTHIGEDEIAIGAFSKFVNKSILFIAPRHPNRAAEIAKIAQKYDLKFQLRSANKTLLKDTHVYIVDTIGELDLFYSIANVTFSGGSLVEHGGQNFVEAAHHKSLILFGPHTSNFKDVSEEFLRKKAAILVNNGNDIFTILDKYIGNSKIADKYICNANALVQPDRNILPELSSTILKHLENDA